MLKTCLTIFDKTLEKNLKKLMAPDNQLYFFCFSFKKIVRNISLREVLKFHDTHWSTRQIDKSKIFLPYLTYT